MHVAWQSMLGRRDRFFGNILFYDYLYRKKRLPFLERNRKQVQSYQDPSNNGIKDHHGETGLRSRFDWRPPSWDLLDDMVSAEKAGGSFVLVVHGIRLENSQQGLRSSRENGAGKKVRTLLRLATSIKTSVVSSSSDPPCSNPPEQPAILRGTDRKSDREASIEMEPIVIHRENWYTDPSNIDENDLHRIMLSINFQTHKNLNDLYDFMGIDIPDTSARLSTSYGNIFDVPQDRVLLPLKASGKQLGLDLEVSMHWNPLKRDSVLTSYNRHLRSTIEPASSYPTPPLDVEPRYKLTFVYGNDSLERSELVCPHCSRKRTTDMEDLKMHLISWHEYFDYQVTLDRVDEYGVEHWRFESEVANYRVGQRASDAADEPFDVRVLAPARPFDRRRYLAGDDEFERAARIAKSTRNAKTKLATSGPKVAPGSGPRKPPDQVQSRPRRKKKTFVVPKAPKGITFFRSISKRPLQPGEVISESDDELDEGWMYCRKHAEIDKTGLSETAKWFLKVFDDFMHEENLQSDMHVGESIVRFAREHGVQLWRDGTLGEFKKKLDELLEDDIISKEVHDALETATYEQTNAREANELSQRLADLDVERRETPLGFAGCKASTGPALERDGRGKGKAVATETGHLDHQTMPIPDWVVDGVDGGFGYKPPASHGYLTPDVDGDVDMSEASPRLPVGSLDAPQDEDADPPYDLCYCGGDASKKLGTLGIIACKNIDCIRRTFHLACIPEYTKTPMPILAQKARDWTCRECKGDGNAAS